MPFSLNVSHSASSTIPRMLVRPLRGSLIQKRSRKLIDESPNPVNQHTGLRFGMTRGTRAAAAIASARDLVRIGVIGNAERHIEPHEIVRERPVDHFARDEVFVRNQIFATVARHDRNEARAQLANPAERFAER